MSPQQLDLAKANRDSAIAAVSAAEAQVTQASAQVQQKEAALTVAQTNLTTRPFMRHRWPVIARNVDVGQTVAGILASAYPLHHCAGFDQDCRCTRARMSPTLA